MASSSTAEDIGQGGRIDRFDGTDPSQYRRWRRRARLMLAFLPTTVPKEKYGPRLMEFIKGETVILRRPWISTRPVSEAATTLSSRSLMTSMVPS